jgi:hypothetical protein
VSQWSLFITLFISLIIRVGNSFHAIFSLGSFSDSLIWKLMCVIAL